LGQGTSRPRNETYSCSLDRSVYRLLSFVVSCECPRRLRRTARGAGWESGVPESGRAIRRPWAFMPAACPVRRVVELVDRIATDKKYWCLMKSPKDESTPRSRIMLLWQPGEVSNSPKICRASNLTPTKAYNHTTEVDLYPAPRLLVNLFRNLRVDTFWAPNGRSRWQAQSHCMSYACPKLRPLTKGQAST
jgi:hypothetical protein